MVYNGPVLLFHFFIRFLQKENTTPKVQKSYHDNPVDNDLHCYY